MELGDALVQISDQLGIAATEIVKINASYIVHEAIITTIGCFICLIVGCIFAKKAYPRVVKKFKDDFGEKLDFDDHLMIGVIMIFAFLCGFLIAMIPVMIISDCILTLLHPDYYAYKMLLESIGKLI